MIRRSLLPRLFLGATVLVGIGGLAIVGLYVGMVYIATIYTDYKVQHPIYPDHINYSKYDFSQFDNTTVR